MTSQTIASAPGKIILSGEHAVVYGYPALVAAVDLYAKVRIEKDKSNLGVYPLMAKDIVMKTLRNTERFLDTKFTKLKINLGSEIPIGSGMGSSAAVSVCVAAALMKLARWKVDLEKINEIAYETEKYYHGNPSGVDPAISTYGGFLWYRKETNKFKTFSKIKPKIAIPEVILINTGKPRENTKEMVTYVAEKFSRNSRRTENIFKNIEKNTRSFLKFFLQEETVSLIELIRENERYLEELGVVSDYTIDLIKEIEKIGGAAKISGAGGIKDNSGILLVYHPDKEKLLNFAKEKKLTVLPAKFTAKGVRIEKN